MKITSSAVNESRKISEIAPVLSEQRLAPMKQNTSSVVLSEMTDEKGNPTKEAFQIAVNKLNEFMEHNQRNSKFIFHQDLGRYYVEMVDASTKEVVKEIPAKALLDAYYEMQKLAGKIFDTQI